MPCPALSAINLVICWGLQCDPQQYRTQYGAILKISNLTTRFTFLKGYYNVVSPFMQSSRSDCYITSTNILHVLMSQKSQSKLLYSTVTDVPTRV